MREHIANMHGLFYDGFFKDAGFTIYSAVVFLSSWAQLIAPIFSLLLTTASFAFLIYRWQAHVEDRKNGERSE